MNNLFKLKNNFLSNKNLNILLNKNNFFKYFLLTPKFSTTRFKLRDSTYNRKSLPDKTKEIKKDKFKFQLDFEKLKNPLLLTSPLISGLFLIVIQTNFVGGDIPELYKFIFKSSFLYGSLFTGIFYGVKYKQDDKVSLNTFNLMKKKFYFLFGVFGLSQGLAMFSVPLPVFLAAYGLLYRLFDNLLKDIHEEIDEIVNYTKQIILFIGLINLIFICWNYNDFRNSINDWKIFDKLVEDFPTINDEKFESEMLEKEKSLRAVDYRLFKVKIAEA